MQVTITEFRKKLFSLVEKAVAGETVEFTHQGATIRLVVPKAARRCKLDRLTHRTILNPNMSAEDHQAAELKMKREMLEEIEKDWDAI